MQKVFVRLLERWLGFCARLYLLRTRPMIVGVTGSVGKTTTKEAIAQVLAKAFPGRVKKSAGNLNNELGLPLSILGFNHVPTPVEYLWIALTAPFRVLMAYGVGRTATILVQEYSAEKPGDIAYLLTIARPHIAVVTNVGPIHLNPGQFPTLSAIAREKKRLVDVLPKDGTAVLNKDNPYTRAMGKRARAQVVWFKEAGADTAFEAALAVASVFDIPKEKARVQLKRFERPYGRLQFLRGFRGATILDDSYNANPMSMEAALSVLQKTKATTKIAALGDMLELGEGEERYHNEAGRVAHRVVDLLVGVGRRARWYNPDAWFPTPDHAASFLKKKLGRGVIVLVKGSQGARMEKVSEKLVLSTAHSKLPRQTPAWRSKPFI